MVPTTPAAPERPTTKARSRARLLGVAALGIVLLAGCTTDNTPKEYNDTVRASFVAACTGDVPPIDGATTTIASSTYCVCAYDVFAANVPYNADDKDHRDNGKKFQGYGGKVFVDLEADLKDDASKFNDDSEVPKAVRDQINACPKQVENVGGTTVPAPPGSVVGPVPGTQPSGSTPPGTTR